MRYSTREAAKKIGIGFSTLRKYVAQASIPLPPVTRVGGVRVRLWSEHDLRRLREMLPKIKNGRKTRYRKKKQSALSAQHSAKAKPQPKKKPQPKEAVPHEKKQSAVSPRQAGSSTVSNQ